MRKDRIGREGDEFSKILLVGNPQVGKTALWSALRDGGRIPLRPEGEIMEVRRGFLTLKGKLFELIDAPGVQSLALDTEEARLIKRLLFDERPSMILLVADAKNLKRGLMLFLEAMELGVPLVMAINMSDEARQRGISIDVARLSSLLGIEACLTSVLEGEGIAALRRCLGSGALAKPMTIYPPSIQRGLNDLAMQFDFGPPARLLSLLLLSGDPEAQLYLRSRWETGKAEALEVEIGAIRSQFNLPLSLVMAEARLRVGDEIKEQVVHIQHPREVPFADRIDHWLRNPATGFIAFALVLVLLFLFVGKFGAGVLGWLLQDHLFQRAIIPACIALVRPLGLPFLEEMLVGPFGLVSIGLSSALGLILPILGTFFFAIALLEDSGYITRLGILLHRLFRQVGLNGKAALTIFLGFSCVTMATLATRSLDSKKERLIATFLLTLGIPCSAQISVIFAMVPSISLSAFLFAAFIIAGVELLMGLLATRIVPGLGSDFIMEVFPLRIPRLKDLWLKTFYRVFWFLKEAIPLFLLGTLILFLSNEIGLLHTLERLAKPVMTGLFGLPHEATDAFMMGIIRKEGSVVILKHMADGGRLNPNQIVITLILTTLFIPCISTVLVVLKQEGLKNTLYIIGAILVLSMGIGGALNHLFRLLGVAF